MASPSSSSNVPVPTPPLAYREPRYTDSASADHFLGPMPVADFLEEFLPKAISCPFEGNPFDFAKFNCETQFAPATGEGSITGRPLPELELLDTADTPDEVFTYVRKPDISVISKRQRYPQPATTADASSSNSPALPVEGKVFEA
ncbi:hypothetical protein EVG20_g10509 [Dentipellis fragilis]|uniref:Uncharacterized protein n=1 Tax=Dentipellis fragilis TaxID=205917 RepID=A0A4Y9XQZ7_9AGAM|nr:hypothetical protein EVG20_g10509 [Dentipellis fragilis]